MHLKQGASRGRPWGELEGLTHVYEGHAPGASSALERYNSFPHHPAKELAAPPQNIQSQSAALLQVKTT